MLDWRSLPATPAVDAALRRAAAEQVMGWHIEREAFWAWDGGCVGTGAWLENWNFSDFAKICVHVHDHLLKIHGWSTVTDVRFALCGLLDLLNITPPEGLEA